MSSFGDKLRQERVSRGVSLDEIAGATGVDRVYLEALEENRFELLTGPAFGKLYVRAYAAVLGFDPEPLIEDYDRERYGRGREEPSTAKVQLPPASEEAEADGNGAKPAQVAGDDADSTVPGEPAAAGPAEPPLALPESPAGIPEEPPGVRPVEPEEPMVETEAPRVVSPTGPRSLLTLVVTAIVALGLVLALAWAVRSVFGRGEEGPEPSGPDTAVEISIPAADPVSGAREAAVPESPPAAGAETSPGRAVPPLPPPEPVGSPEQAADTVPPAGGRLSVAEFGVGRRVVNRRLEGESDRFAEGATACFLTRVLGGEAGESIRHVWLREGRVVQSLELPLGGPHWRTHSRKTLHGLGPWTVEARDTSDRVLARASFTCVPAGS